VQTWIETRGDQRFPPIPMSPRRGPKQRPVIAIHGSGVNRTAVALPGQDRLSDSLIRPTLPASVFRQRDRLLRGRREMQGWHRVPFNVTPSRHVRRRVDPSDRKRGSPTSKELRAGIRQRDRHGFADAALAAGD